MHLYIHIPFCKQKCHYCDFVSGVYSPALQEQYITALIRQLQLWISAHPEAQFRTIFIGGGTPSSLPIPLLEQLLQSLAEQIDFSQLLEYTIEANPESVTEAFAALIARYRVSRVSLGVQSAQEDALALLGRCHDFARVQEAVARLKAHHIRNINLDVIFAIPNQRIDALEDTLSRILALEPTHISCYSLIIEDGTELARRVGAGLLTEVSDDDYVAQYRHTVSALSDAGYAQYEISNFAKPGFASLHNTAYWIGADYIGIGTAAHSKLGDQRFANSSSIEAYIAQQEGASRFDESIDSESIELLSPRDHFNELVFLGLRRNAGISVSALSDSLLAVAQASHADSSKLEDVSRPPHHCDDDGSVRSIDLQRALDDQIQSLVRDGLLIEAVDPASEDKKISLTQRGREISNTVFTTLMR